MRPLAELEDEMARRMHALQLEFRQAADDLFAREDLGRAMQVLDPLGRPDGELDVMRATAIRAWFAQEPLPKRVARVKALPSHLTGWVLADALLYLGAVAEAATLYTDTNSLAVCAELLGRHQEAVDRWRAVELTLESLPLRYNLALSLLMRHRYADALVAFKACRALYPHYRDVLFFVDWVRHALTHPDDMPPQSRAAAMGRPR